MVPGATMGKSKTNDSIKKFVSKESNQLDIDRDNSPDFFRQTNEKKETQLIFKPSRKPQYKGVTIWKSENKITKNIFSFEKLKETISTSRETNKVEINHEYFGKNPKLIRKTYLGNKLVSKTYKKTKGDWKLTKTHSEVLRPIQAETTTSGQAKQNSTTDGRGLRMVPAVGFKIDRSCGYFDQMIMSHASNLIFEKTLPCIAKINPILVATLIDQISINQTTVQCLSKGVCSDDTAYACAYTRPNSDIYFQTGTPSKMRIKSKYKSDEYLVEQTASTLFHEWLHVATGTKHTKGEDKLYTDAVYGCEILCEPSPGASEVNSKVNLEKACPECQMLSGGGTWTNWVQGNICSEPETIHAKVPLYPTNPFRLCSIAGGEYRNHKCFCQIGPKAVIDPYRETCAPHDFL